MFISNVPTGLRSRDVVLAMEDAPSFCHVPQTIHTQFWHDWFWWIRALTFWKYLSPSGCCRSAELLGGLDLQWCLIYYGILLAFWSSQGPSVYQEYMPHNPIQSGTGPNKLARNCMESTSLCVKKELDHMAPVCYFIFQNLFSFLRLWFVNIFLLTIKRMELLGLATSDTFETTGPNFVMFAPIHQHVFDNNKCSWICWKTQ